MSLFLEDVHATNGDVKKTVPVSQGCRGIMDVKRLAVSRKAEDPESPAVARSRATQNVFLRPNPMLRTLGPSFPASVRRS